MIRWMFVVAFVLALIPTTASAFDLGLSIGAKGGLSGSAVRGVPEGDPYFVDGNEFSLAQGPDLYPMFGIGAGVGGFAEVRVLDIVGLEFGVFQSWDNGDGWEDKNTPSGQKIGRVHQEQRTQALHIPIMLKASIPGFIRPTFGLGIELINQKKSTFEYTSPEFQVQPLNEMFSIVPSKYAAFAFSFALEVDLGQIRIPIELRGAYNTGFDRSLRERAVTGGTGFNPTFEYDGKYEGHFALFTGVIYQYDLKL